MGGFGAGQGRLGLGEYAELPGSAAHCLIKPQLDLALVVAKAGKKGIEYALCLSTRAVCL